MRKGIYANKKHSYNDFQLQIADRKLTPPTPKIITEKVPYMNGEYNFSALNGEVALENSKLYYEFDISEINTKNMEQIKSQFLTWIYSINNTQIYDDYLEEYYFLGSFESINWTEDFGKGTVGVTFSVYPYKFSKIIKEVEFSVDGELAKEIISESSHNINIDITTDSDLEINIDSKSYNLSAGTYIDSDIILTPGINKINFIGQSKVIITYRDEVI